MLIPRRLFADPGSSFWTSLRYFCVTRLVIAAVLLGASIYNDERISVGTQDPALFARTAVTYAVLAAMFGYLAATRQRQFYMQLGAQLLVDVLGLTLLMSASGGTRSGLALLLLLPIAGSAILSPASLSLGFAALCSLAILAEAMWRALRFQDAPSSNLVLAGLFGVASFAIAIVMNRLAARLIVQERIARQRGYDLRAQIEINRLVVADMQDGVLILAADGTPRAANPAALRMLGLDDARALVLDGWRGHVGGTAISRQFVAWRSSAGTIGGSFDLMVSGAGRDEADAGGFGRSEADVSEDGLGRRLRVRFVAPEGDALASGRYVVFLEDLLRVEQRAQQLKLAAMGRLTASIAHEIRNPLAAIAHAGALLEEETGEQLGLPFGARDMAGTQRMVSIVRENAHRLNRIVEEILQLSRRGPVNVETIALDPWLEVLVDEFCRTQGCARSVIGLSMRGNLAVQFNGEHLRQVLVNLLSNAVRYATGRDASVTMHAALLANPRAMHATALSLEAINAERGEEGHGPGDRIELVVQDDGPGIDKATRANLFEPFFTTHHRGTGLGLYLARELCLANEATLDYSINAGGTRRGGFVIRAVGTTAP